MTSDYGLVIASGAKQSRALRGSLRIAARLRLMPQFILSGWLASQPKGRSQ
jgi:hypothetical protein